MGLGGVGKTQMALEYAYRHASDYDGIWWLRAEEPATLASDYADLAPHLGVPIATDQTRMVREVRETLSRRRRILLVFDNATDPDTVRPYLPLGPGRRILVTTRAQSWPGADAQNLEELPLEVAVEFLLNRTGQTHKTAAEDVAKRLGCLPLALEQAAAYVVTCQTTLEAYGALLSKHGLAVLEKGQPYQYDKTVGTTWGLAFGQVQARCPAAGELLYLCAFLAPEAIHVRELASARKHLPEPLATTLVDDLGINEIKAVLLSYSLIRTDADSVTIHRLVSEVVRQRMDLQAREQWQKTALRTISVFFPADSDDVRTWPACSRWLAHALAVVSWDSADTLDPRACALTLNKTGLYLMAKADHREAEPLYRRALSINEHSLGPNHPDVATNLGNLASLLCNTNRMSEAEPLYRRALSIDEQSLGPDHPMLGISLSNLATFLHRTDRLSEAEPLYRRALSIHEQSLGPDHPDVAIDLNCLARLLDDTNRLSEAEPLYRRALAINEQSLGPNHPSVARNLNNLALLLQKTDRLPDAEPLLRRALAINEQSLGPHHPEVARNLNNLVTLFLENTNRASEAEPLCRRALAISEQCFGVDHPEVATNLSNLALLLQITNRLPEVEPLYRRALAIKEQSHGPNHPDVAVLLNNLASFLSATNRASEAEPLLRRALSIFVASLGTEHPDVLKVRSNLESATKKGKK